jgi:ribA/ribD-fused uncharacterized protein
MIKKLVLALSIIGGGLHVQAMQAPLPSTTPHVPQTQTVKFYDKNAPYYEFTNFYDAPFSHEYAPGQYNSWANSEQYFQGMKFNCNGSRHVLKQIMNAQSAREAFDLAHKNNALVRPNWLGNDRNALRVNVMYDALKLKFGAHLNLAALLLSTDDMNLVENAGKNDAFWGNGQNGDGTNMLGQLLVELRNDIFSQKVHVHGNAPQHASLSQATLAELTRNGRLDYFYYILGQLQNGQPIARFNQFNPQGQASISQPLTQLTHVQPNHPQQTVTTNTITINQQYTLPPHVHGLRTNVINALSAKFNGHSGFSGIVITPHHKNMLIQTNSPQDALQIVGVVRNLGMSGVNVDQNNNHNIFISRNSFNYLLGNVLAFDQSFITSFINHQF